MSKRSAKKAAGALGGTLRIADFESLKSELQRWRTPELRDLEKQKGSGLVLGFVKGLRLSAGLIYVLRKQMSSGGLDIHWGHLLNSSEDSCSPECDVIIHKPGFLEEWNGGDRQDRVMDFKFIVCDKAIAVISCKSFAKAKDIDAKYVRNLKQYVKHVFLFAECCPPSEYERLCDKAKGVGYSDFCCLYKWDEQRGLTQDLPSDHWEIFVKHILRVANPKTGRKR